METRQQQSQHHFIPNQIVAMPSGGLAADDTALKNAMNPIDNRQNEPENPAVNVKTTKKLELFRSFSNAIKNELTNPLLIKIRDDRKQNDIPPQLRAIDSLMTISNFMFILLRGAAYIADEDYQDDEDMRKLVHKTNPDYKSGIMLAMATMKVSESLETAILGMIKYLIRKLDELENMVKCQQFCLDAAIANPSCIWASLSLRDTEALVMKRMKTIAQMRTKVFSSSLESLHKLVISFVEDKVGL